MTQSNQTQNQYFNLTADGIGFLNRPRTVTAKKGHPYYAATIQASRGDSGDKTRFDVRIVGGHAKELFEQLLQEFPNLQATQLKDRPTVIVGFRVGDLQPIKFETEDRKTGEKIETLSIDARLLKFKFIKVNGEFWYRSSQDEQSQTDADNTAPTPRPTEEVAETPTQ
ncbi:DUF3577 domain-containing protein [Neisseria yangbaofengii]|uniref:DUF3577 domain-containing protein n=1 Tax=Neisseria yangbaofengii TaxID=2709396 RepID=UPI0013EBDA09|nr:DUF3577 domain-containing protein [Neisseria yangbaofengii]